MRFTLTINCEGEAFEDCNSEVARMLMETAAKVRHGDYDHSGRTHYRTIYDRNGNSVGGATYDRTGESGYPPERLPQGHWRYTR